MNITRTLSALSKGAQGRPISDTEILKWANTTVQKSNSSARPIRSFKDPSLTTGIFLLDLLEALRPGIVDPTLIISVSDTGDYEDRRQNGKCEDGSCLYTRADLISCAAKLAISIARKMNALIFLVPEDIVDIRPRLVRRSSCKFSAWALMSATDYDLRRQSHGVGPVTVIATNEIGFVIIIPEIPQQSL